MCIKKSFFKGLFGLVLVSMLAGCNEDKEITYNIGDDVEGKYFQVFVNSASVLSSIDTGSSYTSLVAEDGMQYLVIDISFMNTYRKDRTMVDGELILESEGRQYRYDRSERIDSDGWGLLSEPVNPMATERTKIVYKIPSTFKGEAYYIPSEQECGVKMRIYLGDF